MTTSPPLPSLPGLAWSRHKKPGFATRVASHVSGREVRVALMSYPLYEFEAIYSGLTSAPSPAAAQAALGSSSLQSLMGFFLQLQGQYGTFLYTDPDDNTVTGQGIGVGDGTTQTFVIGRTLGGWNEPVSWVTAVNNVYLNGSALPTADWLFTAPNSIGLATAPGAGVVITADFSYAFQCRFLDDQMDFEEFMSSLWKLDSMKFRSVKANTTAAGVPAPTVLSISPAAGSTTGATAVTITGTFFNGATAVSIGGNPATGVTVVNSTTITATTPAGTGGQVNVSVTTPYGTGTGVNIYTYQTWYTPYAIGGTSLTLFADTTTEGGANHYLYNGTTYGSFAALLTALGITFTRASSAYYTNSSGVLTSASSGAARFDYNPVTLTPKGLLLEGASTNLLLNSQGIGSTDWSLQTGGDTSASGYSSPDGASNAQLLTFGSGSAAHWFFQTFTSLSNGNYSVSFFVKANTGNSRYLGIGLWGSPTAATIVFDLQTVTAVETKNYGVTASSQIAGPWSGFYRITVTVPSFVASNPSYVLLMNASAAGSNSYEFNTLISNGPGTATYYVFQGDLVASLFPSSPILTTTSSVSRAADSLSAATWAAITAGTLYAKADTLYTGQAQRLVQIDDGTANNRATLQFNASAAAEFDFLDGGTSEAALTAGTITANGAAQIAAAFQANDFALVANGGTPATGSSGAVPTFSKLRLGADSAGANNLFGHIAQIGVWNNLRGQNSALQALT